MKFPPPRGNGIIGGDFIGGNGHDRTNYYKHTTGFISNPD